MDINSAQINRLSFHLKTKNKWLFIVLYFLFFSLPTKAIQITPDKLTYQNTFMDSTMQTSRDSLQNTWVRAELNKQLLNKAILVQNKNIHLARYELWAKENDTLKQIFPNIDFYQNPIKSRYPVYYFTPSDTTYYLNIFQENPQGLNLFAQEFGQFGQYASLTVLYLSMYYGLALMCVVFNLVYFIIFQDKRFSSYILLQLAILCLFLYEDGMLFYFSNQKYLLPELQNLLLSIICVLIGVFSYYFLDRPKLKYPYKKVLAVLCFLLFIFLILYYTLYYKPIIFAIQGLCFLLIIWCFKPGITLFKTNTYAKFFVINFGLLTIFCIGYYLAINHLNSLHIFFNINTLRLVSVLEIIAISFVLIFKIRTLKEQNIKYKTELRYYLHLLSLDKQIQAQQIQNPKTILKQGDKAHQDNQIILELQKHYDLTQREIEVLQLIWQGDSNKEIAEKLFLSVHTIKYHVSNLYTKLDVNTRRQVRDLKPNT
ncbi:LuxR C-terminal-related transcriptional regulator [Myroides sp. LJL110]